jgi:exodeoxyribonuclease VII large subunit
MSRPTSSASISGTSTERTIYTISRLNREVKALLEGSFPLLWIEGEISNLAKPSSGHMYFSLKDSQAQVRCALFRGSQRILGCAPRDGMQVLVRARVTLYEGRGEFQLVVEHLEEAGEGALRRAFDLLKTRLGQEGLFDIRHKKSLPTLPRRIGVITSPTGAALRDILTTLKRRFPAIAVLIYPVPVQGEGSAEKIATAIRLAGERNECDALILARGGGSLEDLWSFNEEIVARALHACPLPVVCGVGHETDFTIADLTADARAPTPTAAAEMLSPDQNDWLAAFAYKGTRLVRLMQDELDNRRQRLDWLSARVVHPQDRIGRMQQRLQDLARRMRLAQTAIQLNASVALQGVSARLHQRHPGVALREWQLQFRHLGGRLAAGMQQAQRHHSQRLLLATHRLETLSPLATLNRGYAIVQRSPDGEVVRDAVSMQRGDRVDARLGHGILKCVVEDIDTDE